MRGVSIALRHQFTRAAGCGRDARGTGGGEELGRGRGHRTTVPAGIARAQRSGGGLAVKRRPVWAVKTSGRCDSAVACGRNRRCVVDADRVEQWAAGISEELADCSRRWRACLSCAREGSSNGRRDLSGSGARREANARRAHGPRRMRSRVATFRLGCCAANSPSTTSIRARGRPQRRLEAVTSEEDRPRRLQIRPWSAAPLEVPAGDSVQGRREQARRRDVAARGGRQ